MRLLAVGAGSKCHAVRRLEGTLPANFARVFGLTVRLIIDREMGWLEIQRDWTFYKGS
jgi:hypothetical protein